MIWKLTAMFAAALVAAPTAVAQEGLKGAVEAEVTILWEDDPNAERDPTLLRGVDPTTDPYSWPRVSDYPAFALTKRETGTVSVEVAVGADDRVRGCSVVQGTASKALTDAACPIVQRRGRFRHALSTDGKPRAATAPMQVSFALYPAPRPVRILAPPVIVPDPRGSGLAKRPKLLNPEMLVIHGASSAVFRHRYPQVFLDIGAGGNVTRCRIFITAETDAGDLQMCRQAMHLRFTPELDREGKPVASRDHIEDFVLKP